MAGPRRRGGGGRGYKPYKPVTQPPKSSANFQAEQARRTAMAARRRAEQQTRIQEQKRRADAKARADATKQRRVKHTVKRGQGAEAIARKYKTKAADIAAQTTGGLKAGQILDLRVPDPIRQEKAYSSADYGAPGERSRVPGRPDKAPSPRAQKILDFSKQLRGEMETSRIGTEPGNLMAGQVDPVTGDVIESERQPSGFVDTQRDLDRANLARIQQGYAELDAANRERGQRVDSARLTWQTLSYAWNTGDWELRPKIIDPFTMNQMSLEMQQKVIEELGYYIDEEGYARRIEFLEEGYGMGEGYGYGGGGGGSYEEKIYTKGGSSYRGGASGVRTKADVRRLQMGHQNRSSWRI